MFNKGYQQQYIGFGRLHRKFKYKDFIKGEYLNFISALSFE